MPRKAADPIRFAGIGVASGLGHGRAAFREGLFAGRNVFSELKREGREAPEGEQPFLGVEMPEPPAVLPPRVDRTATLTGRVAASVLAEAWEDAGLDAIAPERIGLVVGGSNLATRERALALVEYWEKRAFVRPRHGHMFLDTDLCGLCTAAFPIRGFAMTVGGASASGAVAIVEARNAIRSGRVDACIALGAMQDLGGHDLQALRALGAMGSDRFSDVPEKACRPMDADHDGFLYGEAAAALVLCRESVGLSKTYGTLLGAASIADGTRGPEPNHEGQIRAARMALAEAGLAAADIDHVNGHATGTPSGDDTELETYRALGLHHTRINATKSILGHGLAAAGAIETAAVLVQMAEGRLHPTRNLETPIDPGFKWVGVAPVEQKIGHALKFSFGFGGVNAALVIGAPEASR
ncbi:malonyl-ACP decarboxylase [Rhodobium orientis]|uniref:Ketosynthase family 3 (KS3) domain-containing protein n=1 Tax=Rhodobium orientis TaxID=34017 RepID=A0A327JW80_9HYPH|nr:beta-ketoacyl synthase N-terminal-like domain-containing protein [Rhodobium orientis]MBB4302677.1 malonyl-ACP decarboxylase [Rhodobium orientis]MBK5948459.1 hypothetical protein [Rhodobium orientis]RAI29733.1 hypothetical protein CH339_01565 [Rhodobium orientis]